MGRGAGVQQFILDEDLESKPEAMTTSAGAEMKAGRELEERWFPLYLPEERRGILYAPAVMTRDEYSLFKWQIEEALRVIEQTSIVEPLAALATVEEK